MNDCPSAAKWLGLETDKAVVESVFHLFTPSYKIQCAFTWCDFFVRVLQRGLLTENLKLIALKLRYTESKITFPWIR